MLEGRIIVCPRVESSAPGTVPLSLLPWNYQGQDPPRPDWQSCQTRRTREVPSLMDWLVVFSLLFLDCRGLPPLLNSFWMASTISMFSRGAAASGGDIEKEDGRQEVDVAKSRMVIFGSMRGFGAANDTGRCAPLPFELRPYVLMTSTVEGVAWCRSKPQKTNAGLQPMEG